MSNTYKIIDQWVFREGLEVNADTTDTTFLTKQT